MVEGGASQAIVTFRRLFILTSPSPHTYPEVSSICQTWYFPKQLENYFGASLWVQMTFPIILAVIIILLS